ncbi:MAG: hypothetical protein H6707_20845 [Deltaproteobacteria bacterium]|nr:hypothetical protein [Deltaproteobacteria bacterium]
MRHAGCFVPILMNVRCWLLLSTVGLVSACAFPRRIVVSRTQALRIARGEPLTVETQRGDRRRVRVRRVRVEPADLVSPSSLDPQRSLLSRWLLGADYDERVVAAWLAEPRWTHAEVRFEVIEPRGTAWVLASAILGGVAAALAVDYGARCRPQQAATDCELQSIQPFFVLLGTLGGTALGGALGWGLHERFTAPTYHLPH